MTDAFTPDTKLLDIVNITDASAVLPGVIWVLTNLHTTNVDIDRRLKYSDDATTATELQVANELCAEITKEHVFDAKKSIMQRIENGSLAVPSDDFSDEVDDFIDKLVAIDHAMLDLGIEYSTRYRGGSSINAVRNHFTHSLIAFAKHPNKPQLRADVRWMHLYGQHFNVYMEQPELLIQSSVSKSYVGNGVLVSINVAAVDAILFSKCSDEIKDSAKPFGKMLVKEATKQIKQLVVDIGDKQISSVSLHGLKCAEIYAPGLKQAFKPLESLLVSRYHAYNDRTYTMTLRNSDMTAYKNMIKTIVEGISAIAGIDAEPK